MLRPVSILQVHLISSSIDQYFKSIFLFFVSDLISRCLPQRKFLYIIPNLIIIMNLAQVWARSVNVRSKKSKRNFKLLFKKFQVGSGFIKLRELKFCSRLNFYRSIMCFFFRQLDAAIVHARYLQRPSLHSH